MISFGVDDDSYVIQRAHPAVFALCFSSRRVQVMAFPFYSCGSTIGPALIESHGANAMGRSWAWPCPRFWTRAAAQTSGCACNSSHWPLFLWTSCGDEPVEKAQYLALITRCGSTAAASSYGTIIWMSSVNSLPARPAPADLRTS